MTQPYPNPDNFTTALAGAEYVNTVTGGWFWILMVWAIPLVVFFSLVLSRARFGISLAIAMYLGVVLGGLVWAIGLIPGQHVVLFLLFSLIGTIISYFES